MQRWFVFRLFIAAGALATALCAAPAQAAAADPANSSNAAAPAAISAAQCRQLGGWGGDPEIAARFTRIRDAPVAIETAEVLPAKDGLPEVCHLIGYVAPSIGFELRMPTKGWNGKFMMQGCGGYCGSLHTDRADVALARNYAVASTDMGHKIKSWLFAYNNIQGEIDFAYRSTHVVAMATKVIIDTYYNKPPARSYFMGCSTGGRQAMVEAQRFPKDFQGIIAGAPPLNETADGTLSLLWSARANIDTSGKPILDASKLPLIHGAVLKACGGKGGVLLDPAACHWDPGALLCRPGQSGQQCLTEAEAGVVRKIYSGATTSQGEHLYYGMPRGSEYNWTPDFIGANGKAGADIAPAGGPITGFANNMAFFYDEPPSYGGAQYDYDKDPQRMALTEALYNAENPDLRKFKAAGGKLILYHGWDDNEVPALGSVDYYETATRTMGGPAPTRDFFRAFLLPGSGHCFGGPGGGEADWITYLENWVEQDHAPDAVTVYKMATDAYLPRPRHPLKPSEYSSTRVVYPYPRLPE